jgi:hypothetical protein
VQAYDSDADGGRHFLVMEYVAGTNLADLLRQQDRIAPTLAADYVHQAALALQHAHEKGLVHRDLKPSNLLLVADGRIKLLDLGLARFLQDQIGDPGRTREGLGMGTPDYAAPEQFHDARSADARSDVYALGCTLYHLVTGQVPFPGSSLTEKYEAHEKNEPRPLEELCPEAPAGVALAVRRMMAKRPADRFQTAQEAAEALVPCVSSASLAFAHLKTRADWDGSRLMMTFPGARRRRPWLLLAGVIAAALLLTLGFLGGKLSRGWERSDAPTSAADNRRDEGAKPVAPAVADVLTVAQDGTGQFRSLGEALAAVKPGMNVRVLDDATYVEAVMLALPSRYAGITLEAPRGATLAAPPRVRYLFFIGNVPQVTLRGFRLRAGAETFAHAGIVGRSPGVRLEGLRIGPNAPPRCYGVNVEDLQLADGEAPVVIDRCSFRCGEGAAAIRIYGAAGNDYHKPLPCSRVRVCGNHIEGGTGGIGLMGCVKQVQVVGNRLAGVGGPGIQLDNLLPGTQDLLIANNTFLECLYPVRWWDQAVRGRNLELRNNLVLGSQGMDLGFVDSGGDPVTPRGAGDGREVPRVWQCSHNWREVRPPTGAEFWAKAWVPPGPTDVCRPHIDVLSRAPSEADFLRPARDSPLAQGGAGKDDPALPRYVGAVPPAGAEPWDWQKTWDARHPRMVLTVSKGAKDGGDFRSVGQALAQVTRPGMTIRVLDNAVYRETLTISRRNLQERLTLEAVRGATLAPDEGAKAGLLIHNVPA